MAAHPSRQSASSSVKGPALVPMGHHAGKPGVPLARPVTVIGSRSTARIHLISSTVSKAHALLVKSNDGIYIRDLASRSHVYVNGEQVREADLSDGDLIKIGSFTFKFVAGRMEQAEPKSPLPAELDVTGGDFPVPVDQRVLLIGRRSSDDIVLLEDSASTAHAVIFEMDGEHYVRDLGSRTGTFVNGVSTHQHKLSPGDVVRIGETDIRYNLAAARAEHMLGDSAAAYALEAPQDEIQIGPHDTGAGQDEHETMGGLDLMGQIVREEVDRDRHPDKDQARKRRQEREESEEREERLQWRRPAPQHVEPIESADEIAHDDEHDAAAPVVDEVHAAQEHEPLAAVDEGPARRDEAPALEPLALEKDEKPAGTEATGAAVPSADIEDLAAELLADEPQAEESLSVTGAASETSSRASEDAAAEAALEPAPVPLEAQGTSPSQALQHEPDQEQEQRPEEQLVEVSQAPTVEPVEEQAASIAPVEEEHLSTETQEAELNLRRGWRGSTPGEEPGETTDQQPTAQHDEHDQHDEPHEPDEQAGEQGSRSGPAEAAEQELTSDVFRLNPKSPSLDDAFRDDSSAGGTAVLDQEALSPQADEPVEAFDFADSFAPPTSDRDEAALPRGDEPAGAGIEPHDLKLEFDEPAPQQSSPALEPFDVSAVDLGIKDEPPPSQQLNFEPSTAEESAPPPLDFSIKESPAELPAPLIDLEKNPPAAPLFKLSDDAEALASATEALTRRRQQQKGKQKDKDKSRPSDSAADEAALKPFAFEEPQIDIPSMEQLDAPIEAIESLEHPPASPSDADDADKSTVEVLDQTQPTPDSALGLDPATEDLTLETGIDQPADADELSDSRFERAMGDLSEDSAGEIIEPQADAAPAHAQQAEPKGDDQVIPPVKDERLAPALDPFQVGANQENFLGGVPLPRVQVPKLKTRPVPIQHDPVDELIAELDSATAAADRAQRHAPQGEVPGGAESREAAAGDEAGDESGAAADLADVTAAPFVPIPPAVPRMPRRARPVARRGVELGKLPLNVDETIPPYKGVDATTGQVTTAFDGLAMPPVRQADVFSQMSPPASFDPSAEMRGREAPDDSPEASGVMTPMDLIGIRREPAPPAAPTGKRRPRPVPGAFKVPGDPFFGSGQVSPEVSKTSPEALAPCIPGVVAPAPPSPAVAAPEDAAPWLDHEPADAGDSEVGLALTDEEDFEHSGPAGRHRVRPALPDAQFASKRRPPVVYADHLEIDPAAQKRKYLRRMMVLIVLGLVLAPLAAVGTYTLVPVRSKVEASITYKNLAERTKRDRDEIQLDQLRRLQSDYMRKSAMKQVLQTPQVSPGFLDDTVKYSRVVERAEWREAGNVWSLVIPYEGTQREQDRVRLKGLATALWDDNGATLRKAFSDARSQVERLEQTITSNQKREQELRGEIASQRILYEQRPSGEQIRLLEGELARRDEAWKKAIAAVKEAEAELNRLKQGGTSSAAAAVKAAEQSDDELAKMLGELSGLQDKADENRNLSTEQARRAREQLDAAMEAFKQEISNANATVPGSPEMAAYIESAQKLQETTRDVIEDMTRRQEQQFNSLMDLKQRLNEKMEARRSEMWQADKELQELTERLAILTRQYNAAVGGGLKRDAEEKKAEVELTQSMIRARQELIPVDPGYAEAIQQIEQFISTTRRNIDEDRKRTDDLLARLQKSFTSGPQLASLPADQQELARRLEQNLSAINEARQQYNQSLDAGAERATDAGLQQQIATLQAGIDARRKQLADQQGAAAAAAPAQAVKQKQAELDNLKQEQKQAETAFFAAQQEMDNARRAVADARASFEKLEKLEAELATVQTTLKTQNDTLVDKQRELKEAVYPEQPTDNDIRVADGIDRRLTYAGIAGGSMLLLFAALVGLTFTQAARVGPIAALAPGDLRPIQHPHPQPTPNGNGEPHSDDNDDHEPAVV